VDIMIPTYGFCDIPPAEEFAENVCDEFFSLPLFPQSSCAFETVCGNGNGNGNGNGAGATVASAMGGSYACGSVAPVSGCCGNTASTVSAASTCSNCGTTCLSGTGSLCPRCGCTMTGIS